MNMRYSLDHEIMYETSMQLREQYGLLGNKIRNGFGMTASYMHRVFGHAHKPIAVHVTLSAPQLYGDSLSQIAGPSLAIDSTCPPSSTPPALGLFIPGLLAPSTSASSGLLSLPSPAPDSHTPSPAMSDIGLLSLPLKRQRLTNSDAYHSVSQPVTAGSMLLPLIGVHWPTNQTWTDADQADWEAGLAWVTDGFLHSNSEIKPLQKIAQRILSICSNSTSCERLFSIFGAILMKWQDWLSTQNLMLLAELKMYLHKEHFRARSVRKHLKRCYCQNTTSEVNQSAESSCVTAEDDADAFVDPQQTSSEVRRHRGLQQIAAQLIQAVEDEESLMTSEIMEAVANPSDFQ
ncbi:hypothetical protein C8R48DRAFT_777396 [Suillus tomentosus]|nr:hypothetical protein C8R48DRAFT_777396 [Suillus tomentosus]